MRHMHCSVLLHRAAAAAATLQNCMCMGGNFFSSRRSTRSAMPPANLRGQKQQQRRVGDSVGVRKEGMGGVKTTIEVAQRVVTALCKQSRQGGVVWTEVAVAQHRTRSAMPPANLRRHTNTHNSKSNAESQTNSAHANTSRGRGSVRMHQLAAAQGAGSCQPMPPVNPLLQQQQVVICDHCTGCARIGKGCAGLC